MFFKKKPDAITTITIRFDQILALTPELAEEWITKPVWYRNEAIYISIGCKPIRIDATKLAGKEQLIWGEKFTNRLNEIERAIDNGDLNNSIIAYEIENKHPAFSPVGFVTWLSNSNLEYPEELNKLLEHRPLDNTGSVEIDISGLDGSNIQLSNIPNDGNIPIQSESAIDADEKQHAEKDKLLCELRTKNIRIDDFPEDLTNDDFSKLIKLLSFKETTQANLIARNERILITKVQALNYMLSIVYVGCKCRHDKLATYTNETQSKWNIDYPDMPLSADQLKELSILIVPPERRFPKRGYDPKKCICKIQNHPK